MPHARAVPAATRTDVARHYSIGPAWSKLPDALTATPGVDRVEVKAILARADHDRALATLTVDQAVETRHVCFLDAPDLRLHRLGVVLRTRRMLRAGTSSADVVVKLRSHTPPDLGSDVYRRPGLAVDLDALPDSATWSATLKRHRGADDVRAAMSGAPAVGTLLDPAQLAFLHALTGASVLDDLRVIGPLTVTKHRTRIRCGGRATTVECWHLPDGVRVLEISTACRPAQAVRVAAATVRVLAEHRIAVDPVQRSKTEAALTRLVAPDRPPAPTPPTPDPEGPRHDQARPIRLQPGA